jgi:hypothetical protein
LSEGKVEVEEEDGGKTGRAETVFTPNGLQIKENFLEVNFFISLLACC